jgi:hypothetical protein
MNYASGDGYYDYYSAICIYRYVSHDNFCIILMAVMRSFAVNTSVPRPDIGSIELLSAKRLRICCLRCWFRFSARWPRHYLHDFTFKCRLEQVWLNPSWYTQRLWRTSIPSQSSVSRMRVLFPKMSSEWALSAIKKKFSPFWILSPRHKKLSWRPHLAFKNYWEYAHIKYTCPIMYAD